MSTLLLRLAAPLQSWGVASKFDTRDTAREPTKSGVIGLLAAALGRSRTEKLDDLKALYFGVRIDQPGVLLRDYHTARQKNKAVSFVTTRYYLADAVFLIGLEGEGNFLHELATALQNPVFPLYLGRRSCPPVGRLVLGLRERGLRQAIEEEPWQAGKWYKNKFKKQLDQVKLTIVRDAHSNEQGAFLRRDLPISFDQQYRRYGFRMVIDTVDALSIPTQQHPVELPTDHDAMAGLGGLMVMYLSRIALNTRRKSTMTAFASSQKLHAAVESSFPPDAEKAGRNLWRIDQLGNALYLLVLSHSKPDFSHIVEQFGWPGAEQKWETKNYTSLMERIETGQRWQFRLRANPVHSVKQTGELQEQEHIKRGKVYAHVTVRQQEQWLLDRAVNYGFSLQEDSFRVVQKEVRKFKRNSNRVTLGIATFEGILEVVDVELFLRTLTYGIGRAKAYGCGLLTIARVSS